MKRIGVGVPLSDGILIHRRVPPPTMISNKFISQKRKNFISLTWRGLLRRLLCSLNGSAAFSSPAHLGFFEIRGAPRFDDHGPKLCFAVFYKTDKVETSTHCASRRTLIDLPITRSFGQHIFPSCAWVKRCSGCMCSDLMTCKPAKARTKTVDFYRIGK